MGAVKTTNSSSLFVLNVCWKPRPTSELARKKRGGGSFPEATSRSPSLRARTPQPLPSPSRGPWSGNPKSRNKTKFVSSSLDVNVFGAHLSSMLCTCLFVGEHNKQENDPRRWAGCARSLVFIVRISSVVASCELSHLSSKI